MAYQIRQRIVANALLASALLLSFVSADEKDRPEHIRLLKPELILAADTTLQGVIAKSKPTLTWDRTDALWISVDEKKQPHFVAARAQFLAVGDQPAQWFYLHESPDPRDMNGPNADVSLEDVLPYAGANIELVKKIPVSDGGAGDFAILLEGSEHRGSVYEIGWQQYFGGSGHNLEERRIFVLHDPSGAWRFIGESPVEDQCNNDCRRCAFKVRWTESAMNPVEILVTCIQYSSSDLNKDVSTPLSDLEIRRDGIVGLTDETIRWTSGQYIASKKGDSIDTISQDIEEWSNKYAFSATYANRRKVRATVREKMSMLNPNLASGRLEPDTRVFVPDPYRLGLALREPEPKH